MDQDIKITVTITTYDRLEFLKETIQSILDQTYQNFKIVIGNNHIEKPISLADLGFEEDRIEILNNTDDLGQIGNMQKLLSHCDTEYFTWIADDDLFDPKFLEACVDAIKKHERPDYIFPTMGKLEHEMPPKVNDYHFESLTPAHYLTNFLKRTWFTTGCIGVFKTEPLKKVGWMEQVGSGRSPGSDALLGVKAGLFENIVVLDSPMYIFRYHDESFSTNNKDLVSCTTAQVDIIEKSLLVLKEQMHLPNLSENLYLLLQWQLVDYYTVYVRMDSLSLKEYLKHAEFFLNFLPDLNDNHKEMFLKEYKSLKWKVLAKKYLKKLGILS